MKNILVLGAGQSAPSLITYLLDRAAEHDWFVTVADRDVQLAEQRVNNHPRGSSCFFDMNDLGLRTSLIRQAAVVVNFMPPTFQPLVAEDCVANRTHMVSASYCCERVKRLAHEAQRSDVLLLPEVGLDPGIDIMSAMCIISRIRNHGGWVERFFSYGSGVPAPEVQSNPLRYCITWNPRNVVMAGHAGAQYLEDGEIKIVPWHQVFHHVWPVEVGGIGKMEAYPNRDSLTYVDVFGVRRAQTMIRGTLRYPGFSETWHQVVRLGLPHENVRIPKLRERSFAEIVEMFLPKAVPGTGLEGRVANYLGISATGRIMDNLRWLGLFSEEPTGIEGETAADAMIHLLKNKLPLPPGQRDMVVIQHEITAVYPDEAGRRENIVWTFVHHGTPDGETAMAKTVGLPAAIAVRLILTGDLPLRGTHIPTHERVYNPILQELQAEGLRFTESVAPGPAPAAARH